MFLNIYEFTADDLDANRRGVITAGQKAWLQSIARGVVKSSRATVPIALVFTLCGLCLILGLALQNDSTRRVFFSGANLPITLAVVLPGVAAFLVLALFVSQRQAEGLLNAQLQTAQGTAVLEQDTSPESGTTSYRLALGKKKIAFGDDPGGLFTAGNAYRVHYIKSGAFELILSYEELAK